MCGIVGYVGSRQAKDLLVEGLEKLEYRGYDSAGIAVMQPGGISICKVKGRLKNLEEAAANKDLSGTLGIGHTRWATHGEPSVLNSHPHTNRSGSIAVVHNGIIENYAILREYLENEGYTFTTDTDTEVIPHLVDYYYDGNLFDAVVRTVEKLSGSYAACVICDAEPDKIVAVRKYSPLIIGLGDGENFVASDIPAILKQTRDVYLLEDNEFAVLTREGVQLFTHEKKPIDREIYHVTFDADAAEKAGYDHFMLKEIHEQPKAIRDTLLGRVAVGQPTVFDDLDYEKIKDIHDIFIVACGTAYHAGLVGKAVIEKLSGIPVDVDVASEFRYRDPIIDQHTLLVVISQSGETADTLAALRLAKERGAQVVAVTNVVGSTAAREADFVFYTHAGPEIAVASTKAYTSQLIAMYTLALFLAEHRGKISQEDADALKNDLLNLPKQVSRVLAQELELKRLGKKLVDQHDIYYLGRGMDYAVAQEGSLKLKEISYIHSETYAGGELKHGPIALIEDGTVVVCVSTSERLQSKMESNIREVVTRGAYVIGIIADEFDDAGFDDIFRLPRVRELLSPVVSIIPLQLLSYYVSIAKGCDVDKPRNLAKSVTVE